MTSGFAPAKSPAPAPLRGLPPIDPGARQREGHAAFGPDRGFEGFDQCGGRRDAHQRILARIEAGTLSEGLRGDRVFLDFVGPVLETIPANQGQETLKLRGAIRRSPILRRAFALAIA